MTPSHTLTSASRLLLGSTLERYGNRLSRPHGAALRALCGTLTDFAMGNISGRKVFALSTGLGKTSAVIEWLAVLSRMKELRHVSVAVSASKVEALCTIKRALLEKGVPEEMIGLRHSLGAAASLPSTGDDDRRFMLVTHQRVRGGRNHELFTQHKGKPRDLMVYDESLFRSDCLAISARETSSTLKFLEERARGWTDYAGVIVYLQDCQKRIDAAVEAAKANPEPQEITLPALDEGEGYGELLGRLVGRYKIISVLCDLVAMAGEKMRVAVVGKDEGVLWHRVSVPEELDRVLVLDASYPIRQLCKLDPTVTPADRLSDTPVKRFDNVTIHRLHAFSGRHSVEQSFRERKKEDRAISREVVEVVKAIPPEESALLFTFKKREVDIRKILLNDLFEAGVDVHALMPNGKPRINVLTWGDETSLNDYAHCENVILAGVLHRSLLDIAAVAVGQLDDWEAKLEKQRLEELLESEVAHSIFQALSRGKCREIDCGQAKPMKAWVIHPRPLERLLEPVLPGAKWLPWIPVHGSVAGRSEVVKQAERMDEYLKKQDPAVQRVPTKQIREALGIPAEAKMTFSRAVQRLEGWERQGQSLVRRQSPFAEAA